VSESGGPDYGLTERARRRLSAAGWTAADWARKWFSDGLWYGDSCGCPDDRCADVRYHHDPADMCGCLDALLCDLDYLKSLPGPTPVTARP
jgi:hypothetical protein